MQGEGGVSKYWERSAFLIRILVKKHKGKGNAVCYVASEICEMNWNSSS